MTIQYALRYETPKEDLVKTANGVITNIYTYVATTKSVAESDEMNGVSAVFNKQDKQVTPWITINKSAVLEDLAKVKSGNIQLEDRLGILLNEGDYVLTSFGGNGSLIICRVLGFTTKLVKIHDLSRNKIIAREPTLLSKISEDII